MVDEGAVETETPPTFDILPLSPEVRRAVDELGYVCPTPVQRAVFEPATRGKDLVVQARTGTGKTAAFALPLVDSIVRRSTPAVQALVLTPTRELALQVTRETEAIAKHRGVKTVPIYGGAPMPRQVELIEAGAQIVVGTPGRVLDHLRRGTFNPAAVRTLVLDESDEMLSMGFLPQINEILSYLPEGRQTLLFSATLPADIKRMAETRLRSPEFLTLSGDHIGALEIDHFVYLTFGDKIGDLLKIIEVEDPESAVIFCNTRDETKRVAAALEQQGFSADWLNADLAQSDREKVMAATRKGELRLLVATDVAARGIDISHLTHVINYDFPESAEAYVHRTGRTGRAGRTGTAVSLVEPSDVGHLYLLRLTYKLRPIEKMLPSAREVKTRAETDMVNLFVEAFGKRRPHPDDLALAHRLMTHESAEEIIAGLLRDHLGARPEAPEEATAARRSKAPRPYEPEPERRAESVSEAHAKSEAERGRSPREERSDEEGRRDGAPIYEKRGGGTEPRSTGRPERRPEPRVERAPEPPVVRTPELEPAAVEREPAAAVTASGTTSSEEAQRVDDRRRRRRDRSRRERWRPDSAGSEQDEPFRYTVEGVEGEIAEPQEAWPASDDGAPILDENSAEIFVNVGRRDGAHPGDFHAVLGERAGLGPEAMDYVRVRHRHTFVGIKKDLLERVLQALNGASIAGKVAMAEIARSRG